MIQTISVKNFKIFKNKTTFPLSKLNLLTGINGRGKSSFLQSLLLIHQSYQYNTDLKKIILNGGSVTLGTFNDLRNHGVSQSEPIHLAYEIETKDANLKTISLVLKSDEEDEMIANAQVTGGDLAAHFERMHYIAADRNGPQELYFKSTLPNFLTVGKKGEYVGNVLLQKKTYSEIDDSLVLERKEDSNLGVQVGVWLSAILDTENVIVDIEHLGGSVIVLNFLFKNDLNNKLKPENVGFGYSYILPIVVAGLIAKPGEILIVENPEAHLHPKAQNRLTKFLARVAACGVQVFVESHSEHILNGLRIATLQDDINIQHDEVNVLYFQDNAKQPFVQLPILKNGKIADWPDGFFDQQEQDLANIFKLGRNKK
jgi:predicted ATPase